MNKYLPIDTLLDLDKREWLEAIENIFEHYGADGVNAILDALR